MTEEVKKETAAEAPATEAPAAQAAPTAQAVPNPAEGNAAPPDLNVSDLNAVRSIIEIATTRGAFKANELEAVGKTFNKLTAFLDHVTKTQQENKGQNNG